MIERNGRLLGKSALITGAATGIGEAIAHKFCHEGASVVVAGLPSDPVDDVVQNLLDQGYAAASCKGDFTREADAKCCVEEAVAQFGKLDILVNNAGVFLFNGETQDYPGDLFIRTILNNVHTTFLMTKFALPYLQKAKGVILAAGSESGEIGLAHNTAYGGTKGWVHAFIRGVAVEQAKYGIRANCVCPGPIDTAWTRKEMGPMTRKEEKTLLDAVPLARRGTPEEVANVYAFLASDEASYVTGALWMVDGGITIAKGAVGREAPRSMHREPRGVLPLKHSHHGLRGKRARSA